MECKKKLNFYERGLLSEIPLRNNADVTENILHIGSVINKEGEEQNVKGNFARNYRVF